MYGFVGQLCFNMFFMRFQLILFVSEIAVHMLFLDLVCVGHLSGIYTSNFQLSYSAAADFAEIKLKKVN